LLLIGSQMAVGGAQHLLLAQARWFRERGYRVVAAFFYDKENLRQHWSAEHGIEIIDLRSWRNDGILAVNLLRLGTGLGRLFRLAHRGRFDVIETFTHHANLLGLPVAWAAGIPLRIGTHHGRPAMADWLARLHRRIINSRITSHFVAVSEHLRREAITRERIRSEKVCVIVNGFTVSTALSPGEPAPRQVLAELGYEPSGRLIVNIGRLIPEKGQIHLIEAMPEVLERCRDARVIIVGDGELREVLQQRVQELELTREVRLLGTRADVPRLLAAAELFVYPSIRDGRPLALLEALSMCVPVVASDCDAMTELLENERTALLFRAGDNAALSRSLIYALENPGMMQQLARTAAQHAGCEISVDVMCQRYDRLFCESGGGVPPR
jgi:glycosyltransferase involved in cell wall biosynthesis